MYLNSFFALILALFQTNIGFAQNNATTSPAVSEVSADNNDKNSIFFMCKRGKELRWLRAFKTETGKCKTYYSKEGYLQVISSATFFSSCEAVLENVKKNLEEGNFKCAPKEVLAVDEIQ